MRSTMIVLVERGTKAFCPTTDTPSVQRKLIKGIFSGADTWTTLVMLIVGGPVQIDLQRVWEFAGKDHILVDASM